MKKELAIKLKEKAEDIAEKLREVLHDVERRNFPLNFK